MMTALLSAAGPELAGTLMSPQEFDAIEQWDERYVYELINGVLVVSPPPAEGERGPNGWLEYKLRRYQEDHPDGKSLDYTLSEQTIQTLSERRRADRVIWAGLGRMPDVNRDPPTVAIEFVSAGRRNRDRDYEAKRQEYAEINIAEYWIVDRFDRTLTVYRGGRRTSRKLVLAEPDVYSTPLLPGFELRLADLFGESDRLEKATRRK